MPEGEPIKHKRPETRYFTPEEIIEIEEKRKKEKEEREEERKRAFEFFSQKIEQVENADKLAENKEYDEAEKILREVEDSFFSVDSYDLRSKLPKDFITHLKRKIYLVREKIEIAKRRDKAEAEKRKIIEMEEERKKRKKEEESREGK